VLVGSEITARARSDQGFSIFVSDLYLSTSESIACFATELIAREFRFSLNGTSEIRFDKFEHALTSGSGFQTPLQVSRRGDKVVGQKESSL